MVAVAENIRIGTPDATMFVPAFIEDFSGGYDGATSPLHLPANKCQAGLNCWLNTYGSLEKLKGFTKEYTTVPPDASEIYDIHRFYTAAGLSYTVISCKCLGNTKVFYYSSGWVEITGGTALTIDTRVYFLSFAGVLYIYNGSEFQYWLGTSSTKADVTFDAAGVTISPKVMGLHQNRLWMVGSADLNTVYFSEESPDETAFLIDATYFLPLQDRGCDLTGITNLSYDPQTLKFTIWRENGTHTKYGTDETDYGLVADTTTCGTLTHRSVVIDGDGNTYSVGNGDIYRNGVSIGMPVRTQLDYWNWNHVVTAYTPKYNVVIFGCQDGTLFWNCQLNCWLPPSSIGMTAVCRYEAAIDKNKVVFARPNSALLYELFSGYTFDGEIFSLSYTIPTLSLTGWDDVKVFKDVAVLIESHDLDACDVTVTIDRKKQIKKDLIMKELGDVYGKGKFGTAVFGLGSIQFAAGSSMQEAVGRLIDINIKSTHDGFFKLHAIMITYKNLNRRMS